MDGRTYPLIEMRGRIKNSCHIFGSRVCPLLPGREISGSCRAASSDEKTFQSPAEINQSIDPPSILQPILDLIPIKPKNDDDDDYHEDDDDDDDEEDEGERGDGGEGAGDGEVMAGLGMDQASGFSPSQKSPIDAQIDIGKKKKKPLLSSDKLLLLLLPLLFLLLLAIKFCFVFCHSELLWTKGRIRRLVVVVLVVRIDAVIVVVVVVVVVS